jgi:toxin ParE1/3/4
VTRPVYYLTPTAADDLREIGRRTADEWGNRQAQKYLDELRRGFERIAEYHKTFVNRDDMNGGTGLSLYHVGKHYVVYVPLTDNVVIIASLVYHSRDIPNHLKEIGFEIRRDLQTILEQIARGEITPPMNDPET